MRLERLGIGTIVLQHGRVAVNAVREVARGETGVRDAARGVDVRRIERDDLLRGGDGVRVLPFRIEEVERHQLGRKERLIRLDRVSQRRLVFASSFAAFAVNGIRERVVGVGARGAANGIFRSPAIHETRD